MQCWLVRNHLTDIPTVAFRVSHAKPSQKKVDDRVKFQNRET